MTVELNKYSWPKLSLAFLWITSLLGLIIRILPVQNLIDNSYFYGLLQSHSHTGFLGWVFIAVYILILNKFGNANIFDQAQTKIVLFVLSFFIAGMTLSFPFFGYNFISISFLSLFLAFSYYALYYLLKSIKIDLLNTTSYRYIKTAVFLYLLSSISPWVLGPIMALGYKKTAIYYNDIFFYLHFLYNGFIVFSLIGIFFLDDEIRKVKIGTIDSNLKYSFYYLLVGTILNYSESVLWTKPHFSIYFIAFSSAILLLVGLFYLWRVFKNSTLLNQGSLYPVLRLALIVFVIKTILQIFQSFPVFASISYDLKSYFIIGYIHLVTLGFITPMLLTFYENVKFIKNSILFKTGIIVYVIGFLLTELFLFGQGLLLWIGFTFLTTDFNLYMLISSVFLFSGISMIFLSSQKKIDLPA